MYSYLKLHLLCIRWEPALSTWLQPGDAFNRGSVGKHTDTQAHNTRRCEPFEGEDEPVEEQVEWRGVAGRHKLYLRIV